MKLWKKLATAALALVLGTVTALTMVGCGEKELIGFDIELARAVGEKLGVEMEFKEIDWNSKEAYLKSGYIDAAWNGMTITEKRKQEMDFSIAYMKNKQVAVVRKADVAKYTKDTITPAGLKELGAKMIAEDGSAGMDVIKEQFAEVDRKPADSQIKCFTDLLAMSADVAILDSVLAGYNLRAGTDYGDKLVMVEGLDLADELYGIGFRKGSAAAVKISEAILELQAEGLVDEIAARYGLEESLTVGTLDTTYESLADKSDWETIQSRGKMVIGFTFFAPIAFYE